MRFLILCETAWQLYDASVKNHKWNKYMKHRKFCTECRIEER